MGPRGRDGTQVALRVTATDSPNSLILSFLIEELPKSNQANARLPKRKGTKIVLSYGGMFP